MTSVFLVSGAAGEWEFREEWNVAAFRNQEDADDLCAQLNRWCAEHRCDKAYVDFPPDPCPLDPQFQSDNGGTRYSVERIELR